MRRALGAGLPAGAFFTLFGLLESGAWPTVAVILLVLIALYGVRVARRMSRVWPPGADLDPVHGAALVRATRRGESVRDPGSPPTSSATPRRCWSPQSGTGSAGG